MNIFGIDLYLRFHSMPPQQNTSSTLSPELIFLPTLPNGTRHGARASSSGLRLCCNLAATSRISPASRLTKPDCLYFIQACGLGRERLRILT
jgi:hypothetical protein